MSHTRFVISAMVTSISCVIVSSYLRFHAMLLTRDFEARYCDSLSERNIIGARPPIVTGPFSLRSRLKSILLRKQARVHRKNCPDSLDCSRTVVFAARLGMRAESSQPIPQGTAHLGKKGKQTWNSNPFSIAR